MAVPIASELRAVSDLVAHVVDLPEASATTDVVVLPDVAIRTASQRTSA